MYSFFDYSKCSLNIFFSRDVAYNIKNIKNIRNIRNKIPLNPQKGFADPLVYDR